MAPEALDGKGYSHKSDIFSIGSILFNLLTHRNLFNGKDSRQVMAKNHECNLYHIESYVKRCSPLARSLLKSMLSKDPELRPTAIEALNHPWFSGEKQPLASSLSMNRYFTGHEFRN
jgi:serine/threonine protein kinase